MELIAREEKHKLPYTSVTPDIVHVCLQNKRIDLVDEHKDTYSYVKYEKCQFFNLTRIHLHSLYFGKKWGQCELIKSNNCIVKIKYFLRSRI